MSDLATLTFVHTVISLAALAAGFVVVYGILQGRNYRACVAIFVATTILTCVTGFMFPFNTLLPSHIFGVMSLVVIVVAIYAFYSKRLGGHWSWIYVACAVCAFYLNAFVAIVQAFLKLPALQPLAPTQSEPPFLGAQLVLLVLCVAAGIYGARRLRTRPPLMST